MIDEEKQVPETLEEILLPDEIDELPIQEATKDVVDKIIKEENIDKLKDLTSVFNANLAKKNAVRLVKLNSLLDKINDEAISRFDSQPFDINNRELIDYMRVVNDSIEKAQKGLESVKQEPAIQINNQKNEINVNINESELNRESKARVMNAVTEILKRIEADNNKKDNNIVETEVIDSDGT